MHLIPSPLKENRVPGVHGERILSSLRVLPNIPRGTDDRSWYLKPIPERHGNLTSMYQSNISQRSVFVFFCVSF